MYTDNELAETIAALQDSNPLERAAMLKALWAWPSQDPRLLDAIRELLNDTAPCTFGTPLRVGEIRWLAAQVLVAEFKARGLKESVLLSEIVTPVKSTELLHLAAQANIECDASVPGLLAAFAALQAQNHLPTSTLELKA